MEAKSQPAGPACCLRDCKLSLRMQTDKQDRHHLPILPSTTETAAHASPFCFPPFFFCPPAPFSTRYFPLFHPCAHMFMNSPYLFPPSPSCRRPSATFCLSLGLFFVYKMSQLAAKSAPPPPPPLPHCSMVHWLSIGGRECLDSFPCFTSLTV